MLLVTAVLELFIFYFSGSGDKPILDCSPLAHNTDSAEDCSELFQEFTAQIPLVK